VSTGALIAPLNGHTEAVRSAQFSADGSKIVTVSDDNSAKIWDASTGAAIGSLNGHTMGLRTAQFSSDGRKIVTASKDNSAKIWLTPEGIMDTLKSMHIEKLTHKDFQELGIYFLVIKKEKDLINYDAMLAKDFWELDLKNLGLKTLPKEISKFQGLTELNLENNGLKTLPQEIKMLKQLKYLYLKDNDFSEAEKEKIKSWLPGCEIGW